MLPSHPLCLPTPGLLRPAADPNTAETHTPPATACALGAQATPPATRYRNLLVVIPCSEVRVDANLARGRRTLSNTPVAGGVLWVHR